MVFSITNWLFAEKKDCLYSCAPNWRKTEPILQSIKLTKGHPHPTAREEQYSIGDLMWLFYFVEIMSGLVKQTHLSQSPVAYSPDIICPKQPAINTNTQEGKWRWSRNSYVLENYISINVITIRKNDQLRLVWVEDRVYIFFQGSASVVSGIYYLLYGW